jgi:hypothetical protein
MHTAVQHHDNTIRKTDSGLRIPYDEVGSQTYHNIRRETRKETANSKGPQVVHQCRLATLPALKSMYKWLVHCAWLLNLQIKKQ